jgi:hypothetical protein
VDDWQCTLSGRKKPQVGLRQVVIKSSGSIFASEVHLSAAYVGVKTCGATHASPAKWQGANISSCITTAHRCEPRKPDRDVSQSPASDTSRTQPSFLCLHCQSSRLFFSTSSIRSLSEPRFHIAEARLCNPHTSFYRSRTLPMDHCLQWSSFFIYDFTVDQLDIFC